MWTILKVFIEFVTILFLFYVLYFFYLKACGVLVPWLGVKPALPALEDEILTTEPPGKSPSDSFKHRTEVSNKSSLQSVYLRGQPLYNLQVGKILKVG